MIKDMADDEAIQATNDDASECKRYAVQLGYWSDPYINFFVKQTARKAPEINRGYYARVKGIESFVDQFLELSGEKGQIINLGAGFDTLYWRLRNSGRCPANFVELDFPSITAKKCYHIKKHKNLIDTLNTEDGEIRFSTTDLHAANYHLVGTDLRHISELTKKLAQAEVNFNLPTMFLAECVLVYVDASAALALLKWLAGNFPNSIFVNYEQVNMKDKFGQVMLSNLRSRGCLLAGVDDCETLETQQRRFTMNNWEGSNAWTMVDVYDSLPEADRGRIEHIEMLDERELLTQLLQHYCISIAWNGHTFNNLSLKQGFPTDVLRIFASKLSAKEQLEHCSCDGLLSSYRNLCRLRLSVVVYRGLASTNYDGYKIGKIMVQAWFDMKRYRFPSINESYA